MLDYFGEMEYWQKQLDARGIDFMISNLAGATKREIEGTVALLIEEKEAADHA